MFTIWLSGFFALFTLGYAVTTIGELVSYPVDTIRRRMMMTSGEAVKYKGSMELLSSGCQKGRSDVIDEGSWG